MLIAFPLVSWTSSPGLFFALTWSIALLLRSFKISTTLQEEKSNRVVERWERTRVALFVAGVPRGIVEAPVDRRKPKPMEAKRHRVGRATSVRALFLRFPKWTHAENPTSFVVLVLETIH